MEPYPLDLEYVVDQERDARMVGELTAIRGRGLERLYAPTGEQHSKSFPELQPRADAFCRALQLPAFGPTATMSAMLKAVVSAYARWGNERQSRILYLLFFDPKGTPPRNPGARRKAALAYADLDDKRFREYQRSLFRDFARFLDAFVTAAIRQATQVPPPGQDETPHGEYDEAEAHDEAAGRMPLWGSRLPALLTLVLAAGLVALALAVVILRAGPGPSVGQAGVTPVTVMGYVECWPDATKPVEGVWIAASSGGSGWAQRHALPGRPNVNWFSYTLPYGGRYVVDVGCGGDKAHWEQALGTVTPMQGTGHYITCYDVPAQRDLARPTCQPAELPNADVASEMPGRLVLLSPPSRTAAEVDSAHLPWTLPRGAVVIALGLSGSSVY